MADTPEMGRTPSTDELVPELTFDEIDRAFDNNEFCFYLQPKCNAATGAIVGAEALVRWNHPKYGVVSPGRFVPMLEQAGQISRLDVFVWRSVVRMLARWEREGRNLVPISVNVSMVDIDQMDVADTLTGLLNEYDVDARLLQAEITESAVARNLSKVESTIRKLHADNIAVLMDDFGSAYSSLNMLKDINVDVIKLDMKFIDLDEDNASKGLKIVESVVNMARKLRLLVIAEGAQTKQQVDQLLSVGMAESDDGEDIPDLVNQAENEMRKDKKRYYASGSGKRQLRTLNKQLEDILVRNKDMESLLQHLNTRYSIAYVVNLRADTQRPVVVPGYVQKMLDKHGGSFREMLLDYCDKLVAPAYRDGFRMLFDYDYVRDRICREGAIRYAYVRNDGERFLITIFPDTHSVDEVMWVFAKEDTSSEE